MTTVPAHGTPRLPLPVLPLSRPLHEVRDDPVDRNAPAVDHHPGLPRGNEHCPIPRALPRGTERERHGHLADGAVRADRQDHPLAGAVRPPDRRLVSPRGHATRGRVAAAGTVIAA